MATALAFSILLFPILALAYWWRVRRDVWIHMHDASLFAPGDVLALASTADATQKCIVVLKVTRYALKVRPL